jgi:RNase P/RNase MRP subunit p30
MPAGDWEEDNFSLRASECVDGGPLGAFLDYRNLRSFRNIFDSKVEINLRDLVYAQLKSADMIVGELRKLREAIEKR